MCSPSFWIHPPSPLNRNKIRNWVSYPLNLNQTFAFVQMFWILSIKLLFHSAIHPQGSLSASRALPDPLFLSPPWSVRSGDVVWSCHISSRISSWYFCCLPWWALFSRVVVMGLPQIICTVLQGTLRDGRCSWQDDHADTDVHPIITKFICFSSLY